MNKVDRVHDKALLLPYLQALAGRAAFREIVPISAEEGDNISKLPELIEKLLPELFPLRPTGIRRALKLSRPIYRRTAAYGHFGRTSEKDGGFSWERPDLADPLKRALS